MLQHLCRPQLYMARAVPTLCSQSLFYTCHFVSDSRSLLTPPQILLTKEYKLQTPVFRRTHISTRSCLHSTFQSASTRGKCAELESPLPNSGVRPRTVRKRHLAQAVGSRDEGLLRGVILGIETSCDETGAAVVQSLKELIERWRHL